jgi:hypothetical protein
MGIIGDINHLKPVIPLPPFSPPYVSAFIPTPVRPSVKWGCKYVNKIFGKFLDNDLRSFPRIKFLVK